ncbi:hypothetical protein T439DRAFT_329285 [Meredithblackwellia eburnea MCA 4105]
MVHEWWESSSDSEPDDSSRPHTVQPLGYSNDRQSSTLEVTRNSLAAPSPAVPSAPKTLGACKVVIFVSCIEKFSEKKSRWSLTTKVEHLMVLVKETCHDLQPGLLVVDELPHFEPLKLKSSPYGHDEHGAIKNQIFKVLGNEAFTAEDAILPDSQFFHKTQDIGLEMFRNTLGSYDLVSIYHIEVGNTLRLLDLNTGWTWKTWTELQAMYRDNNPSLKVGVNLARAMKQYHPWGKQLSLPSEASLHHGIDPDILSWKHMEAAANPTQISTAGTGSHLATLGACKIVVLITQEERDAGPFKPISRNKGPRQARLVHFIVSLFPSADERGVYDLLHFDPLQVSQETGKGDSGSPLLERIIDAMDKSVWANNSDRPKFKGNAKYSGSSMYRNSEGSHDFVGLFHVSTSSPIDTLKCQMGWKILTWNRLKTMQRNILSVDLQRVLDRFGTIPPKP